MMKKYTCPVCGNNSIGFGKKYFAAPSIPIVCPVCGSKLKPHSVGFGLSALTQYALAIYLGFLFFLYREIWTAVVLIVAWVVLDYIRMRFVPLVPKTVN